jgi:protein-S-isoprenylcysteine O-methyltransferase Ste14
MNAWQQLNIETWLWLIFAGYWFVASRTTAKTKARESWSSSLPRNAVLALGAIFLFGKWFAGSLLGRRFVPAVPSIWAAGVLLTIAGLALTFWARYHLGKYWSGQITLKEDHTLVCTGPYSYLRHPIYSGLLVAVSGTGLTVGLYRALLGVALIALGLWWKARQEDAWLSAAFGEQFEQQRRRTGRLLPRFRRVAAGH